MKKIKSNLSNTIIIDKSEFITNIFRVSSVDEVTNILAEYRKKYYDANHNCYAYILNDDASIQKCSDDGEPQKTAGYPMLDVLKKQEITDILAITTRYFGGIKLGSGGLIRAYSQSVSTCLLDAEFVTPKKFDKYLITLSYSDYNIINNYINTFNISDSDFSDCVKIIIYIPTELTQDFLLEIKNLTRSKAISNYISTDIFDI